MIPELLEAHCRRVLNSLNDDELYNYALTRMKESFDVNPGFGDTDVRLLVGDILKAEFGDSVSAKEFIVGAVGKEEAQQFIDLLYS